MPATTPGNQTSEFTVTKRASVLAIVLTLLGLIVSLGPAFSDALANHALAAEIFGGVVAMAGVLKATLTNVAYIKSRTDIKTSADRLAATLATSSPPPPPDPPRALEAPPAALKLGGSDPAAAFPRPRLLPS